MPITAVRHVRRMRGGAQAHLLEADDGQWYVVKFRNNPQHRRILINELLAAHLMSYLRISTPRWALIEVTEGLLAESPELCYQLAGKHAPIVPGWHWGSLYPGDPARVAVYDFLPDALLAGVANLEEFRAALVFDKWTSNADGRQCIFHRARVRRPGEAREEQAAFVARMIDNGYIGGGPAWEFSGSAIQGIYARRVVYDGVRSLRDFEPWLSQVVNLPEEVLDAAWKAIPREWLAGDDDLLLSLLERLYERRKLVPELIESSRSARQTPFANWR
jgi:hypothetical protein